MSPVDTTVKTSDLDRQLRELGIVVDDEAMRQLTGYLDLLQKWSKRFNMTGLPPEKQAARLVVEPLWIGSQLRPSGDHMDLGSGNGSPAIPWRIVFPFRSQLLVEARKNRAAFLRETITQLVLPTSRVLRMRLTPDNAPQGPFDWITSQGVAVDASLLRSLRVLLRPGGHIVWITSSSVRSSVSPDDRLAVPGSRTEALVFCRE